MNRIRRWELCAEVTAAAMVLFLCWSCHRKAPEQAPSIEIQNWSEPTPLPQLR